MENAMQKQQVSHDSIVTQSNGNILQVNALLKYIEFLLHCFDSGDEKMTLKELRASFYTKFHHNDTLLNQYFGIIRLMPLILISEEYKNQKKERKDDIAEVKDVRNSVSHNDFSINNDGYFFERAKGESLQMTLDEFQYFLHRIENQYYFE